MILKSLKDETTKMENSHLRFFYIKIGAIPHIDMTPIYDK